MAAQDLLGIARAQIGYKESPPNSNDTKFGQAFGLNGEPWCAIFVWWAFNQAGVPLPLKTAGVYALRDSFKAANRLFSDPEPGDVVLYNYGTGHCGIVESVQKTTITAIEGNTGVDNDTNGGEVMRRVRPRNDLIFGYGRPLYSSPQPQPTQPEDDDMEAARTVVWADGAKTVVTPDGAIDNWPLEQRGALAPAPSFGSFYSLKPEERLVLNWPLKPDDIIVVTPVNNTQDKAAGISVAVRGKDGNSVFQYDFTPGFKSTHQ